jgi:periplasmic divalent cation tolerance protein
MDDERAEHVVVMTTTDDPEEAAALARGLVEARLAACVQAMPIASTYRWEGAVETADERLLLIKTRADRVDDVKAFLGEHHSYDTPECVVVPMVDGLPAYLAWLDDSVGRGST